MMAVWLVLLYFPPSVSICSSSAVNLPKPAALIALCWTAKRCLNIYDGCNCPGTILYLYLFYFLWIFLALQL